MGDVNEQSLMLQTRWLTYSVILKYTSAYGICQRNRLASGRSEGPLEETVI